jgi:hypothetical protein
MITALKIWLDVERKQQEQQQDMYDVCEPPVAALANTQLLAQLLHVLGPVVLCVAWGLTAKSHRALGGKVVLHYGQLLFFAMKGGEEWKGKGRDVH